MNDEFSSRSRGIEGGAAPSQAVPDDTGASDMSDGATACPYAVQVEQQPGTRGNAGPDALEVGRQSHGAKRRGSRAKLDVDFGHATLPAVRARADRLGLQPGVWVKAVVRDALHASRTEELDAAIAAALVGGEQRAQVSADVRALAAQIRPLAINVHDLGRRARAGEPVSLGVDVPELIDLLREVRELLGDRRAG
ncbi:hypothetical protein LVY72_13975 [Arthrobacter sp. I2-34]|uniref:Uncharacterized protein n=1 Tax=Arthrobacter hankyongi TaxID=2904801 RepID=A0ABS9L8K6_9MICC|nr:hypothetical protein [Arthrobacter hankyongi]MCG2623006.1 hypothetical protein [Arthrobacter hankyongi]